MNMIEAKGAVMINRFRPFIIPLTIALLWIGNKAAPNNFSTIMSGLFMLMAGYYVIWAILYFSPLEVSYDRDFLRTKQLVFEREIAMRSITSVSYKVDMSKINLGGKVSSYIKVYYLVLEIKYDNKKLLMMERIEKREVQVCEEGTADKGLLRLYRFIENEYPMTAKGFLKW